MVDTHHGEVVKAISSLSTAAGELAIATAANDEEEV